MLSDLDLQSMFRFHLKLLPMGLDITFLAHYGNIFFIVSNTFHDILNIKGASTSRSVMHDPVVFTKLISIGPDVNCWCS